MKLTKEACEKALDDIKVDNISYCIDYCSNKGGAIEKRKLHFEGLKTIEQLINEYFNNPPLKFEEIKNNDWIWDDTCKEWIQASPNKNNNGVPCVQYYGLELFDDKWYEEYTVFEENRFYRKRVE